MITKMIIPAKCKEFKAGIGKIDITPNYNSPTRRWHLPDGRARIKSFHHPLYAKTIALSFGDKISTVTSMDVASYFKPHHDIIRRRIREISPFSIDDIIIHNTHQHSDSFIEYDRIYDEFSLNDRAFDMDYINSIPDRVATSVMLALGNLRPAVMGCGSGRIEEGIASCRRIKDAAGKMVWRGSRPPDELRVLARGHIDPELGVLIFSEPDGVPIGEIINYACHPSSAGGDSPNCLSADYPGFATEIIDRLSGGISVFLHGCSGDINPGKYTRGTNSIKDRISDAERMGRILAAETLKTMASIEKHEVLYFNSIQKEMLLPVRSEDGNEALCEQKAREAVKLWRKDENTDPRLALRKYAISKKIENSLCPVNISAVAINNVNIVFVPGEPFTEYGEKIKGFSDSEATLVASTCGEEPFYIPTEDALREGGYECSYIASSATGKALLSKVNNLLSDLKAGSR